jgi:hypothetical protein
MNEPTRLIDTETGRLADLLKDARQRLPNEVRLAGIAGALVSQGVPIHPRGLTSAGGSHTGSSLLGKLGWGLGGVIGIGAVALLLRGNPDADSRGTSQERALTSASMSVPSPSTRAVVAPVAPARGAGKGTPGAFDSETEVGATGAPATSAPGDPESSSASPNSVVPNSDAPRLEPSSHGSEPAPARARDDETSPARTSDATRATSASARSSSTTSSGSGKSAPAEALDEITLLKEARANLSTNPSQALAFTEQHRSDFPRSTMVQEREVIAIAALVRLGNTAAAHERANRFRKAYPQSAYLKQIDRALGESR